MPPNPELLADRPATRPTPTSTLRLLPSAEPPRQLTRFIGRAAQLSALAALLRGSRLVTLSGPGGSGKTRLAAEVAHAVSSDFSDAVAWVDMAPLGDAALVARHVAHTLRIGEPKGRSVEAALRDALATREMLLVLDNCEHLADACASLCAALLPGCPHLRVLATSREPLGVHGEHTFAVPPLSLPEGLAVTSPAALLDCEAVQLFVERASHVTPSFELTESNAAAVAQICRRLDGIPLALELAAARTRVLAPEQIAERLDDAFRVLGPGSRTALPRHRTLRAAIDWSHDLLSDEERILFRRVSVFADGFTIQSAEAVCAASSGNTSDALDAADVLDTLASLVDRSLVLPESDDAEHRFRLLETVRQYAAERLAAAGEAEALKRAHAAHYVALAEEAAPWIFGGASNVTWIRRLERERANLRAAAGWLTNDVAGRDGALRIAAALHWFWYAGSHFAEARRVIDAALARASGADPVLRARALLALGNVAIWQGDTAAVLAPMQQAEALLRDSAEVQDHAYALAGLGIARALHGDHAAAGEAIDDALQLLRASPPSVLLCYSLYWRSLVAQWFEDIDLARACAQEIVAVARTIGNGPSLGHGLTLLGRVLLGDGERDGAWVALREALIVHDRDGDLWGAVTALEGLAYHAASDNRAERATRLLGAARALRERIGSAIPAYDLDVYSLLVASLRSALGDAAHDAFAAEAATWSAERTLTYALEDATSAAPVSSAPPAESPGRAERRRGDRRRRPSPAGLPDAPLTVRALGSLRVIVDGTPVNEDVWRSARARELLVLLLCHPDGCTREQVGVALWPDATSAQVRNSFHVTLHRLRRALGDAGWIDTAGERYRVDASRGVAFDAAIFEAGVIQAAAAVRAGAADAIDHLAATLALYEGEFLESAVAGDWHLEHRARLQRRFADASVLLADQQLGAGRNAEAADTLHALLARDALNEPAYRLLMRALAGAGRRTDALRAYQRLEALLDNELGVQPSAETRDLLSDLRLA